MYFVLHGLSNLLGAPVGLEGRPIGLVPGETVKATVLELRPNSHVVLLVKGGRVTAASEVGPLQPGQVLEGRVGRLHGQLILKLSVPEAWNAVRPMPVGVIPLAQQAARGQGESNPQAPGPPTSSQPSASASQPPVLSGDRRVSLRRPSPGPMDRPPPEPASPSVQPAGQAGKNGDVQVSMTGTPQGPPKPPTAEPVAPLPTVSARGVPRATLLTAEPRAATQPLEMLAATRLVSPAETPRSAPGAPVAGPPVMPSIEKLPAPNPLTRVLRMLLPSDESLGTSLARLREAVAEATKRNLLPARAAAEFEMIFERLTLKPEQLTGERVRESLRATGLHKNLRTGEPDAAPHGEHTLKSWLLSALESRESGEQTLGVERPAWLGEAYHVAQVIERAQVLNALNAQNGQPLFFELLFGWPLLSNVRVYLDERKQDGGSPHGGRRTYRAVTLLDLRGIGPVRADAFLTGRRILVRLFVERADVERLLTGALPLLSEALTAQGYEVDGLSTGLARHAFVRGEELRAQVLPDRPLVRMQV